MSICPLIYVNNTEIAIKRFEKKSIMTLNPQSDLAGFCYNSHPLCGLVQIVVFGMGVYGYVCSLN